MIRPRFRHTGRPCCLILLCLLLLPWLGACAPQYGVSVDSLRGPQADSAGTVYVPRPGVEGMAEDDLRFRDVAAQLEPCFTARGYTLKLDGQPQDKSDNLVFISFGISEPDVRIYTTVSYVPYTWGRGHFRHTRWVREEETRTKVFFHAGLLLEGCTRAPDGGRGKNLWRTEIRCTGQDDDFRTLLQAMLPVLQQHLGKDTGGRRYFVVTLDEDEAPVVEEKEVTAN